MTATVSSSGSQPCTIGTEHTLVTNTAAGTYLATADLAAMVNGDVFELRVYGKASSSDTERQLHRGTYGPIVLASQLVQSLPIASPHHLRYTIKQIAGTSRTIPWALYEL